MKPDFVPIFVERFICPISEKTDMILRKIASGDVAARLEKAALLKAFKSERDRPKRFPR
ncbi:hypothetical protein [Rhizobium leucaenae]|uniref:Uncharacterized protein n=1 Tax=Rhizobium leucaenae TaxID=29450 RepID=A0A7W7A0I2_9HYPH|nr:hypothetical protein [Rhizobium leucaenae]MBB4571707.1 hypothetical protein [Rhizobium leucaenae]MBB6305737.1 hypothetical protein [Rhizobium leucaenae]